MAHSSREKCGGEAPSQELDRLRARNAQLERELVSVHRLATLGTLAGSVAHEFNNILTPVLSYAQLAIASPEDRNLSAKALRKAVEGTEKAAQIASSMLGFVRHDEDEASASVLEVVRDTMGCLARDPAKDGIDVDIRVPNDLEAQISPIALQQVLLNLVLNAIEAIRPRPGRIEISGTRLERSTWNTSDRAGSTVEIRVKDSGRGIPAEIRERLFEPLVSSRSSAESRKGTGLGLSICKTLIEDAEGSIDAREGSPAGAVFEIVLLEAKTPHQTTQRAA